MKYITSFFLIQIIFLLACNNFKEESSAFSKSNIDSLTQMNDSLNKLLIDKYSKEQNGDFLRQMNLKRKYEIDRKNINLKKHETHCGKSDFKNIYEYKGELGPSRKFVLKNATPVGAISTTTHQNGLNKFCSGTLISENLFLTACHCIDGKSTNDFVVFNYQLGSDRKLEKQYFFKISEVLELGYDYNIDYAIVRLDGSPGNQFGYTPVSLYNFQEGESLTIIQHPNGRPKEIEAGHLNKIIDQWITYNDIDTDHGSSGAGILNSNGELVGIHTNGGCDPYSSDGENVGVTINKISQFSKVIMNIIK